MHSLMRRVPNILTSFRLLAGPLVSVAFAHGHTGLAAAGFFAAAATDLVDGAIARRYNAVSNVGSFLDPVADKVLLFSTTTTLAAHGVLPVSLVALIVVRDITLLQGAMWHRYRCLPNKSLRDFFAVHRVSALQVEPTRLSKYNSVLQMGMVSAAMAWAAVPQFFSSLLSENGLHLLVPFSFGLIGTTTLATGFQYYFHNQFDSLPSHGVTKASESVARNVNRALVAVACTLYAYILADSVFDVNEARGDKKFEKLSEAEQRT